MPSDEYYKILEAMEDTTTDPSWAIQAFYDNDDPASDAPRKFLAYLIGGNMPGNDGEEVVLGYQYEGKNTSTDPDRKWRCFKLEFFFQDENIARPALRVQLIPFEGDFLPPEPLTNPEIDSQNCVKGGVDGISRKRRAAAYHS